MPVTVQIPWAKKVRVHFPYAQSTRNGKRFTIINLGKVLGKGSTCLRAWENAYDRYCRAVPL